jgi:hypothetical protein
LLGGDYNTVPIRYGWGSDYIPDSDYEIPSDLYFSDFDGDWNVDGDTRFGEPSQDDVNYGSEIFVGRLLCTNGSQIQAWTQKLLQYEKNPGNGSTSYLKKAFYTQADELQQDDQARDIANRFGSIFTTNTIYEEIYNGTPNYNSTASPQFPLGAQVINEMNTGYGFISWFNHGSPRGIGVGTMGFNECNTDVKKIMSNYDSNPGTGCTYYAETGNGLDNLTASNKPFVLYTLACETTPFDTWLGIAPTDNLGAMVTNQSGKGGPFFLGNTRYGWVSSSWDMQQRFTANITGGTYRLGAAEANSKGSNGDHFVWLSHNLIGCPETEMWTDTPSNFTTAFAAKCGSNVIVNTGGVTYATVCVMSSNDGGAAYWSVDESSPTQKTFYNVTEPFVVTITKHNYIPKIIQSSEISTVLSNSVTGPSIVCSSGASFGIDQLPTGANITWAQSTNITMVSAQGANPCTFSASGNGDGWIEAQIVDACNTTTTLPRKTVWVGAPVISGISGPNSTPNYQWATYTAQLESSLSAPTAYNWTLNPLNGNSVYNYGSTCDIAFYNSGSYQLVVQAKNACTEPGYGPYYVTGIYVYNTYRLSISPNPTTTEATVELVSASTEKALQEPEWSMEVYDAMQNMKTKTQKVKGYKQTIITTGWKDGIYIVRAKIGDEILTGKLVVKP